MNYPPQQPNQPGWGQQPGQGQPYGGQPGGQYPPSGAQPGGQVPPYGPPPGQYPQGPYPQAGPQPQQGFGPSGFPDPMGGGQPPKKKRTGLIVTIVVAAVVLVGGGIVTGAVFLLSGGDGEQNATAQPGSDNGDGDEPQASTPQETVDAYAKLAENVMRSKGKDFDEATATQILCPQMLEIQRNQKDKMTQGRTQHPNPNDPYWKGIDTLTYTPSNIQINGDSGTFDMEMTAQGQSQQKGTLTLNKEGGTWKVCGPPGSQQPNP